MPLFASCAAVTALQQKVAGLSGFAYVPYPDDAVGYLFNDGAGNLSWIGGGGGGATNLTMTRDSTTVTINSDTGTDAIIPAATTLLAGVLLPAEKVKLNNTSGTNTGDQTNITGNAGSATILQTTRTINSVGFNGSTDIVIEAYPPAGTSPGDYLGWNGTNWGSSPPPTAFDPASPGDLGTSTPGSASFVNLSVSSLTTFGTSSSFAFDGTSANTFRTALGIQYISDIVVLLSDPAEVTAAATGRWAYFQVVKPFTLVAGDVLFSARVGPTGSAALADIEKNGVSIYSTRPQIDASEVSSSTGVVGTISGTTASFATGDFFGAFLDQIGSGTPGSSYALTANIKYS